MPETNVVPLKVTPKTLRRVYKTHKYVVTYIPKTKKWKWTVSVVREMVYSDEAAPRSRLSKQPSGSSTRTVGDSTWLQSFHKTLP